MQAPTLTLDQQQAALADSNGNRISMTGAHTGVINQMKWRASDSGAAGYIIDFESSEGQVCEGLFICTVKKDGTVNDIGSRQINALLMAMRVTNIKPAQARIKEDVYVESLQRYEEQEVDAWIYPEVCNRPVGFVLQKELTSRVSDGKDSWRMQFAASFNVESGRTAGEMLAAGTAKQAGKPEPEPEVIQRMLSYIEDKDSRNKEAINYNPAQQAGGEPQSYHDDIPW